MTKNDISHVKTASGFEVKFPKILKDEFKAVFPRAKWNPTGIYWEIGPRSGKRLDQWINEVMNHYSDEALDELEARELSARELEELEAKIANISAVIKRRTEEFESLPVMREKAEAAAELLEAKRNKLDEIEASIEQEKAALKVERHRIDDLLSKVIDLLEIKSDTSIMAKHISRVGSHDKQVFHDAQLRIIGHRNKLREAGFALAALDFLASSNKNRPDRDHPDFVTADMWYQLREWREPEEE